jgi:DNA-directed RNA polymerase alpha subunit
MERDKTYQLLMRPLKSFKFFRMNYKIFCSLRKNEVLSMFHLCSLSREELTNIPGLGTPLVNNIESFLKENNLQLGMDTKLYVQLHDELVDLSELSPSLTSILIH